jgi:hypothetical protein
VLKQGIGDTAESNIPKDCHAMPPQCISHTGEVKVPKMGEDFKYEVAEHCICPEKDQYYQDK